MLKAFVVKKKKYMAKSCCFIGGKAAKKIKDYERMNIQFLLLAHFYGYLITVTFRKSPMLAPGGNSVSFSYF